MNMKNTRDYQRRGGSFTAEVDLQDQKRLNTLFAHERALYNGLIDIFESRTRVFPKTILGIGTNEKRLFQEVAAQGVNWRQVHNKPEEWSENFRKACGEALNKRPLDGQINLMLQELSKLNFSVLPDTKRQMVATMIEFYQEQAEIIKDPQNSEIMEVAYRVPPTNLSRMDDRLKRHAQVPRNYVKFKWDHEKDVTEITTPLTINPVRVLGVNLNELNNWSTLILRQESGRYVDYNTPWLAEFRQSNGKYLLKVIDIGSNRGAK